MARISASAPSRIGAPRFQLVHGVDCILFSDALVAEGALVFAKACEMGLEGCRSAQAADIGAETAGNG